MHATAAVSFVARVSSAPIAATAFLLTSNTPAGSTAFPPPLREIARASNMSLFSSVPLGSLVAFRLKARIWAGHYIEMDLLLGGVVDNPVLIFDIRLQQSSVQTREQAQHCISNITQWTDYDGAYRVCHSYTSATHTLSVATQRKCACNTLCTRWRCLTEQ